MNNKKDFLIWRTLIYSRVQIQDISKYNIDKDTMPSNIIHNMQYTWGKIMSAISHA